jgi:hypothetical protein
MDLKRPGHKFQKKPEMMGLSKYGFLLRMLLYASPCSKWFVQIKLP